MAARCPLPHLDPAQMQVSTEVWRQQQDLNVKLLDALAKVDERVATAVAAERAAWKEAQSNDATNLQGANRLLRETLAEAYAHVKELESRVLGMLAANGALLESNAQMSGQRADVSLAMHRDQRAHELAIAQVEASNRKFDATMRQLGPILPLLANLAGVAGVAGVAGFNPQGASPQSQGATSAPGGGAEAEGVTIDTAAWTRTGVAEWQIAFCEIVQAASLPTAGSLRFYLASTGLVALLAGPTETLPPIFRGLVDDAGPERIRRFAELTAAAQAG